MVSIESVSFDNSNMEAKSATDMEKSWFSLKSKVEIILHFFDKTPDIPANLSDISALRDNFRDGISSVGGGLIKAETVLIDDVLCIEAVFKTPQKPHGMTYFAALTIPFAKHSFVIKMTAHEFGITGMRDSLVFEQLRASNQIQVKANSEFPKGWMQDPYKPEWQAPCLRNKADDEIYDEKFPDHPLSRLRKEIEHIKGTLKLSEELKASAKFA